MAHSDGGAPPGGALPRVAVVTGASAGVGRAVTRALAAEGWDVALIARGEAGLEAAVREVEDAGRGALALSVDVADPEAVAEAADSIEDRFGEVDLWVNTAMTSVIAPFTQITPQEYARVTDVCYLGYVHGTGAALKHMLPRDRGVIVQVGSALAYRGIPLQSAYCGAKHAMRGFTDSVRAELGHERSRIRITEVHLPGLNTPQFSWVRSRLRGLPRPMPPVFDPDVAARAVVFAARNPHRRVYWVGGSTVATVLAARLAPRLLDHYLARTGYEAQEREKRATGAADNLYAPVDSGSPGADFGVRGPFTAESRRRSAQMWLSRNRRSLVAGALTAAGAVAAVWGHRR